MTVMRMASWIALAALEAALAIHMAKVAQRTFEELELESGDWVDEVAINVTYTPLDLTDETYQMAYKLVGK